MSLNTPIKKVAVVYGNLNYNDAEMAKFQLLITDFHNSYSTNYFDYAAKLQAVKALNPDIKIFGYVIPITAMPYRDYFPELNTHEEWFLHDASYNRVYDPNWNAYFMDITRPDYRDFLFSWLESKLPEAPFDGIFIDGAVSEISSQSGVYNPALPSWYIESFHGLMQNFLEALKTHFPQTPVIINSEEGWQWPTPTHDYIQIVDGQFIEGLGQKGFGSTYNSEYTNSGMMNTIEHISNLGKIIAVNGGSKDFSAEVNKFCFALFLLSASQEAYFGLGAPGAIYNQIVTDPLLDMAMGGSDTAKFVENGSYRRNFSSGYVMANLISHLTTIEAEAVPVPLPVSVSVISQTGFPIANTPVQATQALFKWQSLFTTGIDGKASFYVPEPDSYDFQATQFGVSTGWTSITDPVNQTNLTITVTIPGFPCQICGLVFSDQTALNAHIASAHATQPPSATVMARVPGIGNKAFVQVYLRRIRDRLFSRELHKKLHPVI